MKDSHLVLARRHLELVQSGLSQDDALSVLQREGFISQELSSAERKEILAGFVETLTRYLEPQVRRTLR